MNELNIDFLADLITKVLIPATGIVIMLMLLVLLVVLIVKLSKFK